MDCSQSPNVRYVEETYAETWPTTAQYGAMHFGPVTEGQSVYLPMPLEIGKLHVGAQWEWLMAPENQSARHNVLLTWSMRLAMERAQMMVRVRSEVIQRVNEALTLGQIRNAVIRDTMTGRPTR